MDPDVVEIPPPIPPPARLFKHKEVNELIFYFLSFIIPLINLFNTSISKANRWLSYLSDSTVEISWICFLGHFYFILFYFLRWFNFISLINVSSWILFASRVFEINLIWSRSVLLRHLREIVCLEKGRNLKFIVLLYTQIPILCYPLKVVGLFVCLFFFLRL